MEKSDFKPYVVDNGTDAMFGHCYRVHYGKEMMYGLEHSKFADVYLRVGMDGNSYVYCVFRHLTNAFNPIDPWNLSKTDKEYSDAVSIVASYLHDIKKK